MASTYPTPKPSTPPKLFPQTFDLAFLQNRQVAVGDRQDKTGHGRGVQVAGLAADAAAAVRPVVMPLAVLRRTLQVDQLGFHQVMVH